MQPTLEQIFEVVLEALDVTKEEYEAVSSTRERLAVDVKQTMCYLAQRFGHSQSKIGKFLGIDHSTVCYNKRMAQDFCDTDQEYASRVMKALISIEEILKKNTEYSFKGWVARDGYDDSLSFFTVKKPKRIEDMWLAEDYCYSLPKEAFPQITWDSEPVECEMTLRLK